MKIVNTLDLPKGNKLYDLKEISRFSLESREQIKSRIKTVLSLSYYNLNNELIKISTHDGEYTNVFSESSSYYIDSLEYSKRFKPLSDDAYPIFEISTDSEDLPVLEYIITLVIDGRIEDKFKKNYISGSSRFTTAIGDIPLTKEFEKTIKLQWSEEKQGLIVYDHPYEGGFKNISSMKTASDIDKIIKEVHYQAQMIELLSDDGIEVKSSHKYLTNEGKNIILSDLVPKFLMQEANDEEIIAILAVLGAVSYKYYTNKIIASVDKKKITDKIKIPSMLRTKLIYMYGGSKLPDNYEEWFDG